MAIIRWIVWLGVAVSSVAVLGVVSFLVWPSLLNDSDKWSITARSSSEPGSAVWLAAGMEVYGNHCLSCHGDNLQGQPNWQVRKANGRLPAPPHDETGHTWHHPDQVLFALTKYGPAVMAGQGYESDMPAYEGILSDTQIHQVLGYVKSTWPEKIRREQERRSKQMESAQ